MNLKKSLIIGASVLTLAPIASPTIFGTQVQASETTTTPIERLSEDDSIRAVGLTNQMLFDELEAQGYDIHDIFTDEEIENAIAEDNSPLRAHGQTKVVNTGTNTFTLYLNSTYTKTISVLGAGASAAIGVLIGGGGGAALGAMLGQIASVNLDTDKGIYIEFENQTIPGSQPQSVPVGWGYQ